jgi:hypothetical protein
LSHGDDAAVLDFLIDVVSFKFVQSSGVKAFNTSSVILVEVSRNVLKLNDKLTNNTKCFRDNSLLSILKRIIQELRNLGRILLCCLTGMSWIIVSERCFKNRKRMCKKIIVSFTCTFYNLVVLTFRCHQMSC